MVRFTILYTLGLVLFSSHRCQSTFVTCDEIANCLKYTESELCDSDGRKTDVCISWEPSASCTTAIIDDADLLEGICTQDATTPVENVGSNSKVCAANPVSAGVNFHFGIIHSTATFSTDAALITISGHNGDVSCEGAANVCGGSGSKDFKLTFTVGSCPPPCDSCTGWSDWSACTATCGAGATRSKTRTCPTTCDEGTSQSGVCTAESATPCPTTDPCVCTAWANWGACSVTCGASGQRTRARSCNACDTQLVTSQSESCTGATTNCPVDGVWGGWTPWSACPATCGGHAQVRNRACNSPAPAFNGQTCPASSNQTQACGTANCPAVMTQPPPPGCNCLTWGFWSSCTQTCGTSGSRSRTRSCTGCSFPAVTVQTDACPEIPSNCPINGQWTNWSDWSTCIVTCGGASQSRARTCSNPARSFGGTDCPPPFQQTQVCGNTPCGINGDNNSGNRGGGNRSGGNRRGSNRRGGRRSGGNRRDGRRGSRRGGTGNRGGATQQCRQRASQGVCSRARAGQAKRLCIQRACS